MRLNKHSEYIQVYNRSIRKPNYKITGNIFTTGKMELKNGHRKIINIQDNNILYPNDKKQFRFYVEVKHLNGLFFCHTLNESLEIVFKYTNIKIESFNDTLIIHS